MRRLILLTLLLFTGSAHAIALVPGQTLVAVDDHWASGNTSAAQTLPSAATAGNLIVVLATIADGSGTATFTGIDDAGTTVYACERQQGNSTVGITVSICWGIAAGTNPGTGVTITASETSTSTDDLIAIMEFSDADATQASLSDNGANTASVTSHDSGSVTPGVANNVVVAISRGSDREWILDADFTSLLDNSRTTAGYRIQSSDTSQSYTVTSDIAGFAALAIVAFKGAAAPTGGLLLRRRRN